MTDLIFGGIIIILLAFTVVKDREHAKDRRQLITALLSRNSTEFAHAEAVIEVDKDKEPVPAPFVDETSLSDDDFFEAIKKTNE